MSDQKPEVTQSLQIGKQALQSRTQKILVLTGGLPGESRVQRFDKDRLVLGSVVSADFRVAGEGIAPIHAVIELGGLAGNPVVYDLASETGVFVNGKKTITQALKSGDEITVGLAKLKFTLEDRGTFNQKERVRETDGRKQFYTADEDFKPLLLEEGAHVDQIFDYRPSAKSAVEVVMSWADTILNVEHFPESQAKRNVILGPSRDADFPIPALLSNPQHALVVHSGGSYSLTIEPKMSGVIQSQGALRDIKSMGQTLVPFGADDFAKISIGDMDFYVSFTAAPPRLKRGRVVGKDPFFLKVLLTSMAMTGALLYGVAHLRVVQSLEAEQLPERLATILYQPEKYVQKKPPEPVVKAPSEPVKAAEKVPVVKPPEPKPQKTIKLDITPKKQLEPKPIPKEMDVAPPANKPAVSAAKPKASKGQHAAKEGEGARAKGAEGSRGTKKAAPDSVHQKKATVAGSTGAPGAGTSHSQVKQIGNVDFLQGVSGKIENILAGAGAQLGKGGARVKDFGGFDTQGNGGSALSGSGRGGGGSSDIAAGLGKKGFGGGRIGTGLGAAGNGDGIVGGKARVAIRSGGPEEAVVMGSIDADAVEAALLAHKDEFRNCYEREINAEHPTLAGRVGTTFVIGGSGRVTQAGIESTSLNNANVERCILTVIRRIDFPVPRGGGVVQVSYPFKYSSVGR